jgi:hypothetical protein
MKLIQQCFGLQPRRHFYIQVCDKAVYRREKAVLWEGSVVFCSYSVVVSIAMFYSSGMDTLKNISTFELRKGYKFLRRTTFDLKDDQQS